MDASSQQPDSASTISTVTSTVAQALQARRAQMQVLATAQRSHLDNLESQILERLDRASQQIADQRAAVVAHRSAAERQALEADARSATLAERATELDRLAQELERRAADLTLRQETLVSREADLPRDLAQRQAELDRRTQEMAKREADLERREGDLKRLAAAQVSAQEAAALRAQEVEQAFALERSEIAAERDEVQALTVTLRRTEQSLATERQQAAEEFTQLKARAEERVATLDAELAAITNQQTALARREAELPRQLASQQAELERRAADLQVREAQCSHREAELEELATDHTTECATATKRQADAERRLAENATQLAAEREQLQADIAQLRQGERSLAAERQAVDEELTQLKHRAEERLVALASEQLDLQADRERTAAQRRQIADHLRRERDEQRQIMADRLAAVESRTAESHASHEALLQDMRSECARLAERLQARDEELNTEAAAHSSTRAELQNVLAGTEQSGRDQAAAETRWAAAVAENEILRTRAEDLATECEQLRAALVSGQGTGNGSSSVADTHARERAEQLAVERDDLVRRLAEAETALAEARESGPVGTAADADRESEIADLTQRYEMAVRDIRDLKKQNEELAKKPASSGPTGFGAGATLDWEARKRQILASLEEDEGEPTEERRAECVRIEEVVRTTESALRDRDEEIEQLRQQLEHQSAAPDDAAVAETAALDVLFDKDEVICQQRDRLKKLEAELEDKLRQAEIEMSLQRAQLARAQAGVNERQRVMDDQGPSQDQHAANDASGKSKKPPRGRWLSRLGLSEDEK